MNKIDSDSLVDIIFNLRWKSDSGYHTDCYQGNNVNIWRDYFPPGLLDTLLGKTAGERVELSLSDADSVPGFDTRKLLTVKREQFLSQTGTS